jgi:glutamate synthase domain-containing protein 2
VLKLNEVAWKIRCTAEGILKSALDVGECLALHSDRFTIGQIALDTQ